MSGSAAGTEIDQTIKRRRIRDNMRDVAAQVGADIVGGRENLAGTEP